MKIYLVMREDLSTVDFDTVLFSNPVEAFAVKAEANTRATLLNKGVEAELAALRLAHDFNTESISYKVKSINFHPAIDNL